MTQPAPHVDLVLRLLRYRMRPDADEVSPFDPRFRDPAAWRDVVAFASAHFVLQALAGPLNRAVAAGAEAPAEIVEFLRDCEAANAARNAMLRDRLLTICARLGGLGVEPVALKGAAFLATATGPGAPAPWRFMQDLDLLVPEETLPECVASLDALGFEASKEHYDAREEAHYPPLVSPCRTFSVELHTRLFARGDYGLPPEVVVRDAVLASEGRACLRIPSAEHRLKHALVHAQLHNRNYVKRRLVLKDVLDVAMLEAAARAPAALGVAPSFPAASHATSSRSVPVRRSGRGTRPDETGRGGMSGLERARPDLRSSEAITRLGYQPPLAALLAAVRRIAHPEQPAKSRPDVRWAHCAIDRLSWGRTQKRLAAPLDHARLEVHRFRSEPGHLARRLRLLTDFGRLTDVAFNWRHKQRQYRWG